MQGQFKHLGLSNGILEAQFGIFFAFPTKVLNIHNSYTSATPKVGVHLGVIRLHPLHSPPFVKMCFTPNHTFGLMGVYISHFATNPMLGLRQLGLDKKCVSKSLH
jgi:hypothetical protein